MAWYLFSCQLTCCFFGDLGRNVGGSFLLPRILLFSLHHLYFLSGFPTYTSCLANQHLFKIWLTDYRQFSHTKQVLSYMPDEVKATSVSCADSLTIVHFTGAYSLQLSSSTSSTSIWICVCASGTQLRMLSSFAFCWCEKHHDPKQLGKEWIYFTLCLHITVHHWGDSG